MRQHDEADEPYQRRREQQQERKPRAGSGEADCRLSHHGCPHGNRSHAARRNRRRSWHRSRGPQNVPFAAARSGSRRGVLFSRTSTAELAPSNRRLSTRPEKRCTEDGSPATSRARSTASGRTNTSTASPVAIAPLIRARIASPSAVISSTSSPTTRDGASGQAIVGSDEARDERRAGLVVELLRRADLLESTRIHHRNVVGKHQRLGLVVRDVDKGRAEVRLQLLQLDLHVLAQLEVEGAQRLVEQKQRRLEHQAACDSDPLFLPPGELVDALALRAGKADAFQHRFDAIRDDGAPNPSAREAVGDVLADRHHRKQREMLEYHVHRSPVRRHAKHRAATDANVTVVGREKSGDDAQQCRLAAARWTQDREKAAVGHRERQRVDGGVIAVALGDAIDFEILLHARRWRPASKWRRRAHARRRRVMASRDSVRSVPARPPEGHCALPRGAANGASVGAVHPSSPPSRDRALCPRCPRCRAAPPDTT